MIVFMHGNWYTLQIYFTCINKINQELIYCFVDYVEKRSAKLFYKESDSKYFFGFSVIGSLLQSLKSAIAAQKQLKTIDKQIDTLCSNKTLFTKTGGGPNLAGHELAGPGLNLRKPWRKC